MKKFVIALLILLFMNCAKMIQKQPDDAGSAERHDFEQVQETIQRQPDNAVFEEKRDFRQERNSNYEIIDWDELISIRLEEYVNNNTEYKYDEEGAIILNRYIPNSFIASLDIIFCYYTVLDDFFSPDEKEGLIKKLREEYYTYDKDVFESFPDIKLNNLSIEDEHYVINTWKMITALFSIFNYSIALDEYISSEDKDRIVAKVLLDFLKTELSWTIDRNSLTKFFPFPFVRFKSQMDNVRTYSIDRHIYSENMYKNTIIHYKTKTGSINAAYIGTLEDYGHFHDKLGFNLWDGLYVCLTLEDDAYVFTDYNVYTQETFYTVIKVYDEKIEPYPVFNGFSTLSYTTTHWSLGRGICGSDFGPNSYDIYDKSPFWIGINYNGRERLYNDGYEDFIFPDWDTLTFTYNGSEFIGDYDLFYELNKIR